MTSAGRQLRQAMLSSYVKWRKIKLSSMKPIRLIEFVEFTPRDLVLFFHRTQTPEKVPVATQHHVNIFKRILASKKLIMRPMV